MSENIVFTFEEKKKLADKIQKLTNLSDYKAVHDIIIKYNPDLPITKNKNGYFMHFQSLEQKTYSSLIKLMQKIDSRKIKEIESEICIQSENLSEDAQGKTISKKLRLTNTENHILNRVKYENELKKNDNSYDEMSYFGNNESKNEIFVKNTKKSKKTI